MIMGTLGKALGAARAPPLPLPLLPFGSLCTLAGASAATRQRLRIYIIIVCIVSYNI